MGIFDSILLAFIAGMAVRDLWPLCIGRAAAPKRAREPRRVAGRAVSLRRDGCGRGSSSVLDDQRLWRRWLTQQDRQLKLSRRDAVEYAKAGRILLTHPLVRLQVVDLVERRPGPWPSRSPPSGTRR